MAGEADVILVPKADLEAMRKAARQMQETLEKAAEQAANDVENELKNGVSDGIKDGANGGFNDFGLKAKAAIASFAFAAGSIIKDSLEKTLGDADTYVDEIERRAQRIRDIMSGASVFGVDETQYAALTLSAQSQGIEQDDLRGIFEGFASALDSPEMKAYKDIADKQGLDQAFFNLLMTAAEKAPGDAQTWLATTAQMGDSDATLVNKLANVIRDMESKGIAINRENYYNHSAGYEIPLDALGSAIINSKPNLKRMQINDSKLLLKELLKGVPEDQASAVNSRKNKRQEVMEKHLDNITLKVQTANFMDDVNIAQMDATVGAINVLESILTNISNSANQTVSAFGDLVDDPTVNSAKKAILSGGELMSYINLPVLLGKLVGNSDTVKDLMDKINLSLGSQETNNNDKQIKRANNYSDDK
ncbi:hypothetical protein IHC92_20770 [Photobacterium damselae subsp. damselae]|uniref:hypothetical protein n=1 Tax=Photobacterium damselae TaxID=38293 RepID=UPI001F423035|nr:hypothetical protein [Photobacterium damselae]UKA23388.1 hypothetical protein IHC92_20770 [Photobacterium damselae subsp. damselae]